jgi:syntaxin 18
MDITPQLSELLAKNGSRPLIAHPFDIEVLNSFLQEAYRINRHITELTQYLRSVRAPYLALGSHRPTNTNWSQDKHAQAKGDKESRMTDDERRTIEEETKDLIGRLSRQIRQLSEASKASSQLATHIAQQTRSKKGFGALGRWAAGGGITAKSPEELEEEAQEEAIKTHRNSVIWYLQKQLERVVERQRDMVERRLERTVEKNKSSLYKAGIDADSIGISSMSTRAPAAAMLDETPSFASGPDIESLLSPEQIQLFESEQEDMVKYFNSELQKITWVSNA